jgi:hypothetical protein
MLDIGTIQDLNGIVMHHFFFGIQVGFIWCGKTLSGLTEPLILSDTDF